MKRGSVCVRLRVRISVRVMYKVSHRVSVIYGEEESERRRSSRRKPLKNAFGSQNIGEGEGEEGGSLNLGEYRSIRFSRERMARDHDYQS